MNLMVPGIGGSLNLAHPDACQSLIDAAIAAGVTVVRGCRDVRVGAGSSPVGALRGRRAGRRTPAVAGRRCGRAAVGHPTGLGITLERQAETSYIAGLLLDGVVGVPDDHDVLVGEDDRWFLLFHQGGSRPGPTSAPGCPASIASPDRKVRPLPRSLRGVELSVERAGRRSHPRRSVRDLPGRRHVVRRAVRRRGRADRRRGRPQRPDHRPGPVDRPPRRADRPRPRAQRRPQRRRVRPVRSRTDGPHGSRQVRRRRHGGGTGRGRRQPGRSPGYVGERMDNMDPRSSR